MTALPEPQHSIANLIDQSHEDRQERPRPHMGCSTLGHKCDRWLWLSFRWAIVEKFQGRILRLFRRGHNEEAQIQADLKSIGVVFRPIKNEQARVDFGHHISGSLDDIIDRGLPGAEKTEHVAEYKTHAKKSFDDMTKNGVEKSKPMHWAQMQLYMKGKKIKRAFYLAVCKDDDQLYTERVKYDEDAAEAILARGKRIVAAERMPDPLSTRPDWYECKFCAAYKMCHQGEPTKEVNCRTCAFSTPKDDSTWHCARHNADDIPVDFQHEGCDSHVIHPDLVPWEWKASTIPEETIFVIDGVEIRNGEGDAHTYSSKEILANPSGCASGIREEVREVFPNAKVSG